MFSRRNKGGRGPRPSRPNRSRGTRRKNRCQSRFLLQYRVLLGISGTPSSARSLHATIPFEEGFTARTSSREIAIRQRWTRPGERRVGGDRRGLTGILMKLVTDQVIEVVVDRLAFDAVRRPFSTLPIFSPI
jgi:hypothetical protein